MRAFPGYLLHVPSSRFSDGAMKASAASSQLTLGGSLGIACERELAGLAATLGANQVRGLSLPEAALVRASSPAEELLDEARSRIVHGDDPLGDLFCSIRSPRERRGTGAIYTPAHIVQQMLAWLGENDSPDRVIDPGTGSGRFLMEAGRRFPDAELIGIEVDPLAALLARANLAVAGLAARAEIILADYRTVQLPRISGQTAFIGNPPYIRHHLIGSR